MKVCASCRVMCRSRELRGGLCADCFELEYSGRSYDLRSGDRRAHRTDPAFTARDADDLETYCRAQLPPAHGACSLFGEMCRRIGENTNPKTDELPTAPECEWVQVESSANRGDFRAVEDGMIHYLEARGKVRRSHVVLRRLPPQVVDVLEARYAKAAPTMEHSAAVQVFGTLWEVAQLAVSAGALRARVEADEGHSFTRRDAIVRMVHYAKAEKSKDARESAKAVIARIRAEAAELVEAAEVAYGLAAVGVQPW